MRRTVLACVLLAALLAALLIAGCGGTPGYSTPYGPAAHSPTFGLPPAGYVAPPTTFSTVLTTEMFDTVTLSAVPPRPRAVAGYLPPSSWPTYAQLARAFPSAVRVPIAVQAFVVIRGVRMGCLDVEPRDAIPSQVVGWIRVEIHVGVKPCVYSNLSEWGQIRADLNAAGIPRSAYFAWLALWVYHPGLTLGFDAQQWSNHALGRSLDESTTTLAFLGLAAPAPAPARLRCFGRGATPHARGCQPVLRLYARRTGAAAATTRALHATRADVRTHACVRPFRRTRCVRDGRLDRILSQRARWYTAEAAALRSAYS